MSGTRVVVPNASRIAANRAQSERSSSMLVSTDCYVDASQIMYHISHLKGWGQAGWGRESGWGHRTLLR